MTKQCKRPFIWPKRRKFIVTRTHSHTFAKDEVFVKEYWSESVKMVDDMICHDRFWWGDDGYVSVIKQVVL